MTPRVTRGARRDFAGRDRADRVEELLGPRVLQQEAGSAGAQRLEDVLVALEGRHDQDAGRRTRLGDAAGGLDAVDLRHPDVHQDHVGPGGRDEVERRAAVLRLPDDLQVVLGVEDRAQAATHEVVVVGQGDPDRAGRRHAAIGMRTSTTVPPPAGLVSTKVPPRA